MSMPTISVVLTHFNKGLLLQRTIESLEPNLAEILEIIVVDDCSTNPDWPDFAKFLEQKYFPKVKIINNAQNKGPATRLNQGGNAAQGEYIFFMDADDVLAPNSLLSMLDALKKEDADLFYGKTRKVSQLNEVPNFVAEHLQVSSNALDFIIQNNIVQMCVMCRQDVWKKSGGCNQNLFIQDESLALSLAAASQKLIYSTTPAVFIILEQEETKQKRADHRLSQNLNQQHHDTFFTIYDFLDHHPVKADQQLALKKKALSMYWKSLKSRNKKTFFDFVFYVIGKINPELSWLKRQDFLKKYFSQLDHVRKP